MTGIIAHRGFNGLYPENTLRSFEEALKLDIAGIECDVNLTADGQVVVIHDLTVDRTSDGSGEVAQMPLDELRQLGRGHRDAEREQQQVVGHPPQTFGLEVGYPLHVGHRALEADRRGGSGNKGCSG